MVLRMIIRAILSRPAGPLVESLVEKLSNTRPIRRSAQLVAYFINTGGQAVKSDLQAFLKSDRIKAIRDKFGPPKSH